MAQSISFTCYDVRRGRYSWTDKGREELQGVLGEKGEGVTFNLIWQE